MVRLLKKKDVQVVTKNGECEVHITLDLNISLNADGLQIGASAGGSGSSNKDKDEDEDFEWAVPDFGLESTQVDFGKKVKEEEE
jgi:hypothetical protein